MAYLEWSPTFETGIPGIDYEHRKLVGLLNEIHASIAEGAEAEAIADELVEFHTLATGHFALEEAIMQDEKYAGLDERRTAHHRLLDQVGEIIEACEAGCCQIDESLPSTLKDWLLEAIAGDVAMLAAMGEAGLHRRGLRRG